jgi:SAM-dependent methyltransferase
MPSGLARASRFDDLTETTGTPVTAEAARMMYTRYAVGAGFSAGRRVLEVGCGGGNGLGILGASAASLVGGDCSAALLAAAHAHYRTRVPLVRLTAGALPFRGSAFDVVLCFETTYYIPDMTAAFAEIRRVLAPRGIAMFVSANPERPDFIPSPHSTRYHRADEYRAVLAARQFDVTVDGAFPVDLPGAGPRDRVASVARRTLQALGLVPSTLRGRARLKRLVFRNLSALPAELPPGFAPVEPLERQAAGPVRGFKVLYVAAVKRLP